MKALLVTITALGLMVGGSSQNVPSEVLRAFQKKYVKAINTTWSSDNSTYSVVFEDNGLNKNASYQKDGEWIQTITELSVHDLMSCITNYVDNEYLDASILEASLKEAPELNEYHLTVEYLEEDWNEEEDVESENNTNVVKLIFDTDCELIRKE